MVNGAFLSRSFHSDRPYIVGVEKLREFAQAVGSTQPANFDAEAARALGYRDVVATPTFAVVIAQRAEAAYVAHPDSGIDFSHVVHAEETFTHHRPIVAGDVLATEVVVDSLTERAGLAMVTTRTEITDAADGSPVSTVVSTLAIRASEPESSPIGGTQ